MESKLTSRSKCLLNQSKRHGRRVPKFGQDRLQSSHARRATENARRRPKDSPTLTRAHQRELRGWMGQKAALSPSSRRVNRCWSHETRTLQWRWWRDEAWNEDFGCWGRIWRPRRDRLLRLLVRMWTGISINKNSDCEAKRYTEEEGLSHLCEFVVGVHVRRLVSRVWANLAYCAQTIPFPDNISMRVCSEATCYGTTLEAYTRKSTCAQPR